MEKDTVLNFNPLVHNVPLSPADEQLINWWHKMYGKTVWMWVVLLVLLLPVTALAFFFFLQGKVDLIAVLVSVPLELLFIWKLVEALRKIAKIKSALRKGWKQISTGKLLELKTSKGNRLTYNVANSIIKVNAPGPYNGLIGARYLKEANIRLETIAIAADQNLLLNVQYPDIPQTERDISNITPQEQTAQKQKNKEDYRSVGKVLGFILSILFVGQLCIAGIGNFFIVFGVYAALALIFFISALSANRYVQGYKHKLVLTGTVTEAIEMRYNPRYSHYKRKYWYRVGPEMVPCYLDSDEHLAPGDKARFEYYANDDGKRKQLIKITRLT